MKRKRRNAETKDPQGHGHKQMRSHLRRRKSKRVKGQFKKDLEVHPADVQRIERLLGNRFQRK